MSAIIDILRSAHFNLIAYLYFRHLVFENVNRPCLICDNETFLANCHNGSGCADKSIGFSSYNLVNGGVFHLRFSVVLNIHGQDIPIIFIVSTCKESCNRNFVSLHFVQTEVCNRICYRPLDTCPWNGNVVMYGIRVFGIRT